jgi:hypothetical protein
MKITGMNRLMKREAGLRMKRTNSRAAIAIALMATAVSPVENVDPLVWVYSR